MHNFGLPFRCTRLVESELGQMLGDSRRWRLSDNSCRAAMRRATPRRKIEICKNQTVTVLNTHWRCEFFSTAFKWQTFISEKILESCPKITRKSMPQAGSQFLLVGMVCQLNLCRGLFEKNVTLFSIFWLFYVNFNDKEDRLLNKTNSSQENRMQKKEKKRPKEAKWLTLSLL